MGRDPEEAGGGQRHSACGVAPASTCTSEEDGDDEEDRTVVGALDQTGVPREACSSPISPNKSETKRSQHFTLIEVK